MLAGCQGNDVDMNQLTGRERAEALVSSYARFLGVRDRNLDSDNDISFGETGLHYDEARNVIYGRAYVTPVRIKNAPEERLVAYRRMVGYLNNPAVGGMYDTAGGYFVLNEQTEAYYLVKAFPVEETDGPELVSDMEKLADVSARWLSTWFVEVADVANGRTPPPAQFTPYEP